MNRTEYVKAVAEKTGMTQKATKEVLDAMQEVAVTVMAAEDEVKIFEGVTLSGVKKEACVRRNPMTGADVNVPEKIAPKCKFGAKIKAELNA